MTTCHELKTLPGYFQRVWTGEKTFEIRIDDRGYQKGDTVVLREWDRAWPCGCDGANHVSDCAKYTGRSVTARIGCVIATTPGRGSTRGFNGNGYVVFSLCDPQMYELAPGIGGLVKVGGGAPSPADLFGGGSDA